MGDIWYLGQSELNFGRDYISCYKAHAHLCSIDVNLIFYRRKFSSYYMIKDFFLFLCVFMLCEICTLCSWDRDKIYGRYMNWLYFEWCKYFLTICVLQIYLQAFISLVIRTSEIQPLSKSTVHKDFNWQILEYLHHLKYSWFRYRLYILSLSQAN